MEHYRTSRLQAIDVIREWDLNFSLGNVVKYVGRAGKKKSASREEDLLKALWYLVYELTDDTNYADDCVDVVKSDMD